MLHLIHCPENGEKPFLLVRSTPARPTHTEGPSLRLIAAFNRNEVVELGDAIVRALGETE